MINQKSLRAYKQLVETRYNYRKFQYSCDEILNHIDLFNKKVLDVGCGVGLQTLYWAFSGKPYLVIGLDSEQGIGAPKNVLSTFRSYLSILDIDNVKILKANIGENCLKNGSIDVIILNNAAHHFYETEKSIKKDRITFHKFREIFTNLYTILKPGGKIVICEIMKYNLSQYFNFIYRNNIIWPKHQMPKDWIYLMKEIGFKHIKHSYYTSYKLRYFKPLTNNLIISYLTKSRYHIYCTK